MGDVFLVEDDKGTLFALKTLKNEEASEESEGFLRFRREIDICKNINQQNIVKVVDFNHDHKPAFMVMEYMKNGSLQSRLSREGKLVPLEVLKIAIQVASALKIIQSMGITHRDVKPANILIAEDGSYKLTDLGLASLAANERLAGTEDLTMSQTALGTPYYIAPEQAVDAKSVDIRADIYSLGATLYHCLTGHRVHEGNSSIHVMMKHLNDDIKCPQSIMPDLPENMTAVIMKMLEKDVKKRYQSPDSLLNDLNKIQDYDAPPEDLIASRMSLNSPRKTNRTGMLMFASFAVLIAFTGYAFVQSFFAPPDKTDKFYQKERLEVKHLLVEKSVESLIAKASAIEQFLIEYPTEQQKPQMKLAAKVARLLASTETFHITVKKAGNLKDGRSFAVRLFIDEVKKFEYETEEQRKFVYPEARVVLNWHPGTKVRIQLEEFDWQNETMYNAVLGDFFSLRGLSGDKVYRVKDAQKIYFNEGLLHIEYIMDEVSEFEWQAFEDYIYPGEKW
jgi:serine/threonine protein kinase